LTVNGTGFVPGSVVNWNGQGRKTTFVSPSQLQASITATDVAQKMTAAITVASPAVGASNIVYFTVGASTATAAFAPLQVSLNLPSGTYAYSFAVGDFNKDGKLDIAYATGNATINVLLGNGDGTFQPVISTVFDIDINSTAQDCYGVFALVPGNFNGDDKLDLAMGYGCADPFEGGGYDVLFTAFGRGDGTFSLGGDGSILGQPSATGDFNGDGYLDVTSAWPKAGDPSEWIVQAVEGQGSGSFGGSFNLVGFNGLFSIPAVGDFNHDGRLDAAMPGNTPNIPYLYVVLGNGDGTFPGVDSYRSYYDTGSTSSAAAGDLNGDGNLDIVEGSLSVFLGKENGTFQMSGGLLLDGVQTIQLADFNNDNKLDAAFVEGYGVNAVAMMQGNGDGTFQGMKAWGVPNTILGSIVGVGDFDGSGSLGFAAAGVNSLTEETSLWLFLPTTLSLSPGFINFYNVEDGSSKSLNSTLTNTGTADATIGPIQMARQPRGNNFSESNNCGSVLAAGSSCTITVTFTPVAKDGGTVNGTVSIGNAGPFGGWQYIVLSGEVP
jgi:hypothetical protein